MGRTPLAWCNLTHDRVRFFLYVLGIGFAVILMFVQQGFRNALLDSNTLLVDAVRADLILVSPSRQALAMRESFPRERLHVVAGVAGVQEVHPLYLDNAIGSLRDTHPDLARRGPARAIRVIGVDLDAHLLELPELDPNRPGNHLQALRTQGTALYDRSTKKNPENPAESLYGPLYPGLETELTRQNIRLVGSFELGTDFTTDGTLIVSEDTYLNILRRPFSLGSPSAEVDLGLVRLKPGADIQDVQKAIRARISEGMRDADVEVLTRAEMANREQTFWKNNTPIGFAFGFGMFMGFAVGLVICYQILSGDVADHLPEYATLKAMGYGHLYLTRVVLEEALILAVAGFLLGGLASWGAYELLSASTGLPMRMTFSRAGSLFIATVLMCAVSGMIALIGLLRADPADVFG